METTTADAGFVSVPYLYNLSDQHLHYKDILVYTAIKSFRNSDTSRCIPSHDTIAKRAGCSRNFVRESVLRLERSGLMKIVRPCCPRKPTNYYFPHLDLFNRIPISIFDADLTVNERAMLICLVQFFVTLGKRQPRNITHYAAILGLSYSAVIKQCRSLVSKGFIKEEVIKLRRSTKERHYYELSDKLQWHYPKPSFVHSLEVNEPREHLMLILS